MLLGKLDHYFPKIKLQYITYTEVGNQNKEENSYIYPFPNW